MACQTAKRKKYESRKGLLKAAESLGVTYSHLRRVLIGERPGKSLKKRYADLKKLGTDARASQVKGRYANSPKRPAPSISLAAAENLLPAFITILDKLGMEVVIVAFTWEIKEPAVMGQLLCEKELEAALKAASAGYYDSTHYGPTSNGGDVWHFFHTDKSKLATAMQILKEEVEARGLLARAQIWHVEDGNTLRVWYPPTAETVSTQDEET